MDVPIKEGYTKQEGRVDMEAMASYLGNHLTKINMMLENQMFLYARYAASLKGEGFSIKHLYAIQYSLLTLSIKDLS